MYLIYKIGDWWWQIVFVETVSWVFCLNYIYKYNNKIILTIGRILFIYTLGSENSTGST